MPPAAIGTTPPTNHTCLTSTRAPRPHGTPQGQPAARSKALAPPEALAKDTRPREHDAVKVRRSTPPAAIGTTLPTPHTRLTSTRAPRPHSTLQGQPAARSEARVLARAGVEGRHFGLAAACGEARQQPRRRRREDAHPGPHSKHCPPEKSSPFMSPAPPPGSFSRSGFSRACARRGRAARSPR